MSVGCCQGEARGREGRRQAGTCARCWLEKSSRRDGMLAGRRDGQCSRRGEVVLATAEVKPGVVAMSRGGLTG